MAIFVIFWPFTVENIKQNNEWKVFKRVNSPHKVKCKTVRQRGQHITIITKDFFRLGYP